MNIKGFMRNAHGSQNSFLGDNQSGNLYPSDFKIHLEVTWL